MTDAERRDLMARPASGQIIEPKNGRAWALRFRAYGERHYLTLGTAEEGWNRERAERELRHILADVERGLWRPPAPDPEPVQPREGPGLPPIRLRVARSTQAGAPASNRGGLRVGLDLPPVAFFRDHQLTAITVAEVLAEAACEAARADQVDAQKPHEKGIISNQGR